MDGSSAEGLVLDPSNCSKLSLDEKREIVYALSDWSQGAPEMLQSWSRQEILEILCAELGKERKYTGLTKIKIIENLLKIVSEKKSNGHDVVTDLVQKPLPDVAQRNPKRQRKTDKPSHLPSAANSIQSNSVVVHEEDTIFCKNSACRARLFPTDFFCKRCSCCICYQFDDNKDPSLWLTCSSDPPFLEESCGLSCHLECALKHERSGIGNDKFGKGQDGSFYCVSCGKENDAVGPCRKQLLTARDTRRVDELCYRVSLSQKILYCTKSYENLCNVVNEVAKMLEAEVGLLTGLPVKRARGIVNRLSCGSELQRLCNSAIDYLDSKISERARLLSDCKPGVSKVVVVEDVSASTVTGKLGFECSPLGNVVGYTLWHRKADDSVYPAEPTCTVFAPCTDFFISGLIPDTEYVVKVVSLDRSSELGMQEIRLKTVSCAVEVSNPDSENLQGVKSEINPPVSGSSLSNSSSVEDETSNGIPCKDDVLEHHNTSHKTVPANHFLEKMDTHQKEDGKSSPDNTIQTVDETTSTDNGSNTPTLQTVQESIPFLGGNSLAMLPITPCKNENINGGVGKRISSSKPTKFNAGKEVDNGCGGKEEELHAGSSSKKRSAERPEGNESNQDNKDFEYYVKVVRWLECDGHIETGFRQKFLTWYSLRATKQEMKIVKVFVDTFIEDPASLAGQLIDTFSDVISNYKSTIVPAGFCLKLWH